jgi:hypothetical protein
MIRVYGGRNGITRGKLFPKSYTEADRAEMIGVIYGDRVIIGWIYITNSGNGAWVMETQCKCGKIGRLYRGSMTLGKAKKCASCASKEKKTNG